MSLSGSSEALGEEGWVGGLLLGFGGGIRGDVLNLGDPVLDQIFVCAEEWLEDVAVDPEGSVEVGEEKPDEESESEPAPVWDDPEDETEEGLKNVEETEDHPVREPSLVIILVR